MIKKVLYVVLLGALAGCGTEGSVDTGKLEQKSLSDVVSMVRRADGDFDVVCRDGHREVVTEAQVLANQVCGGSSQIVCVPHCVARYSDGSCRQYGADFCGPAPAKCIPYCTDRYSDGSCRTYGVDICGTDPHCVKRCQSRYSDGSCRQYAADYCGAGVVQCVSNCIERYSDGSCRTYGADICSP